jgi:hypothetical protein
MYLKRILISGLAYIENSSTSLEGIKDEIQKVLRDLTDANNATVGDNFHNIPIKLQSSLNSIRWIGKYIV